MQPGATVGPGHETQPQEAAIPSQPQQSPVVEVPQPPVVPSTAPPVGTVPPVSSQEVPFSAAPEASWRYNAVPSNPALSHPDSGPVTWTASEFVAREKSFTWYLIFVFGTAAASAAVYFITRDIVMVVIAILSLGAFGILASRHPRVLEYRLDDGGITIGSKRYPYNAFKSFALMEVGAMPAIDLMSAERFKPPVTIYPPPDQQERILDKLSDSLPLIHRDADLVERLMHRIHF